MDDLTPGLESASEGAEDLELEPKEPTEPTEPGGDPLDDIQDEAARAEAKKNRAIARRLAKKEDTGEEPKPKEPRTEYLTKQDFFKANERKAIREVTADPEVKAVWDQIIPFYTPRRGKETPEDIKEDIQDAITLYRARNPVKETDDSAKALIETPVVKAGGEVKPTTEKPKTPPNFKLPAQPKDWYQKAP